MPQNPRGTVQVAQFKLVYVVWAKRLEWGFGVNGMQCSPQNETFPSLTSKFIFWTGWMHTESGAPIPHFINGSLVICFNVMLAMLSGFTSMSIFIYFRFDYWFWFWSQSWRFYLLSKSCQGIMSAIPDNKWGFCHSSTLTASVDCRVHPSFFNPRTELIANHSKLPGLLVDIVFLNCDLDSTKLSVCS